ncbi:hypothetical protein [Streptomyces sp. 8P21H-1]|uniref:hypothetical protein n=1 Tax=Streptomyces sp. 8P21H-1 TaxID=2737048 RepID=UPI0020C6A07D|nr:hypothetical protein [Streptomyces sp. 8P21H-1]
MDRTQPARDGTPLSKAILITLVALFAVVVGLLMGIYASRVGDLTFYSASAAGGGAWFVAFTLGLMILSYLRE